MAAVLILEAPIVSNSVDPPGPADTIQEVFAMLLRRVPLSELLVGQSVKPINIGYCPSLLIAGLEIGGRLKYFGVEVAQSEGFWLPLPSLFCLFTANQ